jgi:hypothetical protein
VELSGLVGLLSLAGLSLRSLLLVVVDNYQTGDSSPESH